MFACLLSHAPAKTCLSMAAAMLCGVSAAKEVAQVTLVMGHVQLERADGQLLKVLRGQSIEESDRLRTGADGMIMLMFNDQGRVALRPDSELLIRKYQYDPQGQESDLQLELLKGTVRQISGKAAKNQPQRYRLNTPVAAIGVRGTDFLAKVEDSALRTYVNEGAIVIQSPQQQQLLLSQAGEGYSLAYQGVEPLHNQKLKIAELDKTFSIHLGGAANSFGGTTQASGDAKSESTQLLAMRSSSTVARATTAIQTEWLDPLTSTTAKLEQPELPPARQQLVWGALYENAQALPLTLLQTYASVSDGGQRTPTVGQPQAYVLWRDGQTGQTLDKNLSGTASFTLTAGEGYYASATGQTQSAQLSNAKLGVDFDHSSFNTRMQLASSGNPSAQLQLSGAINPQGIFVGKNADQHLAGALSLDGKQAGYLFNLNAADGGAYRGITLWSQQSR